MATPVAVTAATAAILAVASPGASGHGWRRYLPAANLAAVRRRCRPRCRHAAGGGPGAGNAPGGGGQGGIMDAIVGAIIGRANARPDEPGRLRRHARQGTEPVLGMPQSRSFNPDAPPPPAPMPHARSRHQPHPPAPSPGVAWRARTGPGPGVPGTFSGPGGPGGYSGYGNPGNYGAPAGRGPAEAPGGTGHGARARLVLGGGARARANGFPFTPRRAADFVRGSRGGIVGFGVPGRGQGQGRQAPGRGRGGREGDLDSREAVAVRHTGCIRSQCAIRSAAGPSAGHADSARSVRPTDLRAAGEGHREPSQFDPSTFAPSASPTSRRRRHKNVILTQLRRRTFPAPAPRTSTAAAAHYGQSTAAAAAECAVAQDRPTDIPPPNVPLPTAPEHAGATTATTSRAPMPMPRRRRLATGASIAATTSRPVMPSTSLPQYSQLPQYGARSTDAAGAPRAAAADQWPPLQPPLRPDDKGLRRASGLAELQRTA